MRTAKIGPDLRLQPSTNQPFPSVTYALLHSTQRHIFCVIVICSETEVQLRVVNVTANLREVTLDNLKKWRTARVPDKNPEVRHR